MSALSERAKGADRHRFAPGAQPDLGRKATDGDGGTRPRFKSLCISENRRR
jgi:hypothetical protein